MPFPMFQNIQGNIIVPRIFRMAAVSKHSPGDDQTPSYVNNLGKKFLSGVPATDFVEADSESHVIDSRIAPNR